MPAADATPAHDRHRRVLLIVAVVALLVFVLIAVLVRARAGGGLDGRVLSWFAVHRRAPLTDIAVAFDRLGRWWVLGIGVAVLVGVLWWTGRMVQAVYIGATVGISLTINLVLKIAFQRQPPGVTPVVEASLYAFPSGHTMTATAIASALAVIAWPTRWRWPVLALAALFSVSMAVSRVYVGAHWPSDVAAGLAVGVAVALAVRLLMPWPTPEEAAAARSGVTGADATPSAASAPRPRSPAAIDVVFIDWGNTLMVDTGMREGPMKDWETVEAEPGAQVALRSLRARYRVVVATNAEDSPASEVRMALARVGLDELVDDVVSSADVGDHKPNYAFYRAALLRAGMAGLPLDPLRAVMVGDGTTNDIAGAQHAGLRTIWYNPTKRRFPGGALPPDAMIRRLIDLTAVVDRLAGVTPERRSRKQRRAEATGAGATATPAEATAALRAETTATQAATSAAAAVPAPPVAMQAPLPAAGPSSAPTRPRGTRIRVNLATRIVDVTSPQPPEPPAAPEATPAAPPAEPASPPQPPVDPAAGR